METILEEKPADQDINMNNKPQSTSAKIEDIILKIKNEVIVVNVVSFFVSVLVIWSIICSNLRCLILVILFVNLSIFLFLPSFLPWFVC